MKPVKNIRTLSRWTRKLWWGSSNKYTVMGSENWGVLTDNSFESLKQDDIEKSQA